MRTDSSPAQNRFAGQVAIITGGSRGLGRAFAEALAREGATVAVVARSAEQLAATVKTIEATNGRAHAFVVDVTDQQAVERMIDEAEGQLGPVDLLINNAGVITPLGPLWEVDPDEWWRCLDINLRGTFLCTRAVLASMTARRRGRIINIASAASRQAIPYGSAYVISKTAIARLTENLALETQAYGIHAFAVDPGTIRTTMTEYLAESPEGRKWAPWFAPIFDEGRDDPIEPAVRLVVALASGQADPLSGTLLYLYDDLTELVERAEEVQRAQLYVLRVRGLGQAE